MPRRFVFRHIDSLIVLRENTEPPTDQEWDSFLNVLSRNWERFESMKILVRTSGGGPMPAQQMRLRGVLKGKPILVAVVSESVTVRFLTSSVALLNRDIKSFDPDELQLAYAHLGLTAAERRVAEKTLAELAPEVGLSV
jgi:hypothetical protein